MRFRDVRSLLKKHIDGLDLKFVGLGNGRVNFENRDSARMALASIRDVPSLKKDVGKLLNHGALTADSSVLDSGAQNQLVQQSRSIKGNAEAILHFMDAVLPEEPNGFITISLPKSDYAPEELQRQLRTISLAFEHPLLRALAVPTRVTLTEPGSTLIELGFAACGAYSLKQIFQFVGKLLDLGIQRAKLLQERAKVDQELAKARQETAKAEQEERKVETSHDDFLPSITRLENRVKMLELQLEANSMETQDQAFELSTDSAEPNETAQIVRNSIEQIADLYANDARFELQLDAPREIIELFPEETQPRSAPEISQRAVKGLLGK